MSRKAVIDESTLENVIETDNVTFYYDNAEKPSLSNVCVKIRKGVKTVILGSNGAGKSTLFYQFNGVEKPEKGVGSRE